MGGGEKRKKGRQRGSGRSWKFQEDQRSRISWRKIYKEHEGRKTRGLALSLFNKSLLNF